MYTEANTEVTPQRHILTLLQPFVILSNITIVAPITTRSINLKLKQTGLLTLPTCFGKDMLYFYWSYYEAPLGVNFY